jgi:hypothetical protein
MRVGSRKRCACWQITHGSRVYASKRCRAWEARASNSLRLTFELRDDVILLRNVGAHDDTLKNP